MFGIRTDTTVSLRSFHECERHANAWRARLTKRYASVWGNNCVPLASSTARSKVIKQSQRLEWVEDGDDSRWACVLYRTHVVSFMRDGRVALDVTYDTQSTRAFFSEFVPPDIWELKLSVGRAYVIGHAASKWRPTKDDDVEYHEVHRDIHPDFRKWGQALLVDETGRVLNPLPWTAKREVSDRERRKEILTKLKPFTTWFNAMCGVGNGVRGVLGDSILTESATYGVSLHMHRNAVELLVDTLMDGNCEQMPLWNEACWNACVEVAGRFWATSLEHVLGADRSSVLNSILRVAYRRHDGYKIQTTVFEPGVKPVLVTR